MLSHLWNHFLSFISMEKQIKNFWVAGFFLPAINATVFSVTFLSKYQVVHILDGVNQPFTNRLDIILLWFWQLAIQKHPTWIIRIWYNFKCLRIIQWRAYKCVWNCQHFLLWFSTISFPTFLIPQMTLPGKKITKS